jgi:ferredoxin-thioredoxin reductase catalytic subunit
MKDKIKQKKRFEIVDHAIKHGWLINPAKGMEVYVENITKFGYCPCDSSRPDCPCPEAEAEVTNKGRCRCGLYWRNYEVFRQALKPLEEKDGRSPETQIDESDPGRAKE